MVTGGAGFISGAMIRELINQDEFNVVNLDKLTYSGNLDSLSTISQSSHIFENIDICDDQALYNVLKFTNLH